MLPPLIKYPWARRLAPAGPGAGSTSGGVSPPSPPPPPPGAGINKPLVPRTPTFAGPASEQRLRQGTQITSMIFNSLMRKGQLVQDNSLEWTINLAAVPPVSGGATGTFTDSF